jgi:hypothetical protein
LQRRILQAARREPFKKPWTLTASTAYAEQVGTKRHIGGFKGDKNLL